MPPRKPTKQNKVIPPIPLAQIFGKGGSISPTLIKKIKKAAASAYPTPSSKKTSMRKVVKEWAGVDILESCDCMPDMDDDFASWSQEWRQNSNSLGDTQYAIEIGTTVWLLVIDKPTQEINNHPQNHSRETKYEWTFNGQEASVWDGEVVYVPLAEPQEVDDGVVAVGFFVPMPALYVPEDRKGSAARTGKEIEREVKFAKSKGGGEWTVLVYKDGTKSCNCPSWIFHGGHNGTGCKHTEKV